MELFKHSLKRGIFYLPIVVVFFLFSTSGMIRVPLLMPYPNKGLVDGTEMATGILCIAFCSFILPDKYEIELALICGVRTEKLFFVKIFTVFIYTLAPMYLYLARYRYMGFDGDVISDVLPFHAPDGYKLYVALSIFITLFFFFALFSFFRVVTQNCYIPLILCLFVNTFYSDMNRDIRIGELPFSRAIADPFISTYLMGEIPEGCKAAESAMPHLWMCNRLLFLGLGILFAVLTFLLLRRERLHRGLGD